MLHAYVTDAAWTVDAEVRVPIAGGRVDFDRVVVEHIGPNSSMGVSHMGVYVDGPGGRIYTPIATASHEVRGTFDRTRLAGELVLRDLAYGELAAQAGVPEPARAVNAR